MAERTAIEWANATFNPWIGCTKVSPACDHCYAEAFADTRMGLAQWGNHPRRRTSDTYWRQPLRWNREAAEAGIRRRVFCASLADVADNQVPIEWFRDLLVLIASTPQLDWLLLTKRPQNLIKRLSEALPITAPTLQQWIKRWLDGNPPANVWLGTTTENQQEADRRIPILLSLPAARHFISCEPLLGPINLSHLCIVPKRRGSARAGIHVDALRGRYLESGLVYTGAWDIAGDVPPDTEQRRLDWVIVGGESGQDARPMHVHWARALRDQCAAADVPFFFKQWGEWAPPPADADDSYSAHRQRGGRDLHVWPDGTSAELIGKSRAGRLLDAIEHSEIPA